MTAKRNKKALIGSFDNAAEKEEISADVFQEYLTQAIDVSGLTE